MNGRVIAVQDGLSPVRDELNRRGHRVVDLSRSSMRDADVLVITGGDDNVMGIEDIETRAPVIVAEGKTAAEICDAIESELRIGG